MGPQSGYLEAEENLKFLNTLKSPCEILSKARPREIPGILPGILCRVRLIWEMSNHFKTSDRMVGLLRKISNEIINRCCAHISLEDIFDGDVLESLRILHECIDACNAWEEIYMRVRACVSV